MVQNWCKFNNSETVGKNVKIGLSRKNPVIYDILPEEKATIQHW